MDEIGRSFPSSWNPPRRSLGWIPGSSSSNSSPRRKYREAIDNQCERDRKKEAGSNGLQRSISIQRIHISYLSPLLVVCLFFYGEKPLRTNNIEIKRRREGDEKKKCKKICASDKYRRDARSSTCEILAVRGGEKRL